MKENLQEKLYETYPEIFKDKELPESESCMHRGIETGDGWYDLIDMLCQKLQWQASVNKYPQVVAEQVKQECGSFNFIFRTEATEESGKFKQPRTAEYLRGMVHFAESMSKMICEKCGAIGEPHGRVPRMYVRCDDCFEEVADRVNSDMRRSRKEPYFEVLEGHKEEGRRGVLYSQRMHPNPRFYKYYWHVFSRSSVYEGEEFFEKCKMSTYEAAKEMKRLEKSGETFIVFNYSLPRSGPDTPFNKNKSKHWAPPYDDDTDKPAGEKGYK